MGQTSKRDSRETSLLAEDTVGDFDPNMKDGEIGPPPFIRRDGRFGVYEWIKTAIMIPFIPIRIAGVGLFFFTYIFLANLATIGTTPEKPMRGFRRAVFNSGKFFVRGMLFCVGFYWIPVRGAKNWAKGKDRTSIVVGNHTGYLEILTSYFMMVPSYIAKDAVKKILLIGRMAVSNDGMFVSREKDARVANAKLVGQIKERAHNWDGSSDRPPLFLFPEGTTTNGRFMLPFKRGAFEPGVPVQPMVFKVHWKHFSPTWETIDTMFHTFRLLTQFVNFMEVIILPVYHPSEQEKEDPALYAENVRRTMAKAGGYQLLDGYGLRHKRMYHQLMKSGELTLEQYMKDRAALDAEIKAERVASS